MDKSDSSPHIQNTSEAFLPNNSVSSIDRHLLARTKSRDRSSSPFEESAKSLQMSRNPPISSGEVNMKEPQHVKSISDLNESQTERLKMQSQTEQIFID